MGGHINGDPLRQRSMVHHDDPPQALHSPPARRRHSRSPPHPRYRRLPRRHPHRILRRAWALQPLPPRHQFPRRCLRRLRRHSDPQADRRRRLHHRVERSDDFHNMYSGEVSGSAEDAGGGAADRRRRRARGGSVRPLGRRREVWFLEAWVLFWWYSAPEALQWSHWRGLDFRAWKKNLMM